MGKGAAVAILLAAGVLVQAGCGSARRSEPIVASVVPADARLANGRKVFLAHCHACHPHGEAGVGPALNNKPAPGFLIRTQVRRGLGAMPAFPREAIADGDLDDLVAYLKALRGNR